MIRIFILLVVLSCRASGASAGVDLLTHGSPAPKFAAGEFLRGPAVAGLAPGTVYVIEFSGTQCAPCREAIPHLEGLQRTYKEVIFLSVFSEPAADVRRYLDGPGKGITLRVACDPGQALMEAWSIAAAQFGIPHVFVVDGAGKIAWIGHPMELDGPLARVVAGQPIEAVEAVEAIRRENQQVATLRQRQTAEREVQAEGENRSRVTPLIQQGQPGRAVEELDRLIATYADLPNNVATFRARKLFVLGLIPGRGEEAFALARGMAVEAHAKGGPAIDATSNYLMNHYEGCQPANRDKRMLALALALLGDATIPDDDSLPSLNARARHFEALSRASHLQADRAGEAAALRQAIAANEQVREHLRSNSFGEQDIRDQERQIAELTGRLAALEKNP